MDFDEKVIALCAAKDFKHEHGLLQHLRHKYGGISELRKQMRSTGELAMLKTDKDGRILVYIITKRTAAEPPSYKNFKSCLNRLAEVCIENKISRVSFPKMAYGLDKMNWRKVVVLLNKLIIDQGVQCSVYTNKSRVLVNSIREKHDSVNSRIEMLQHKDEEISKLKEKVKK